MPPRIMGFSRLTGGNRHNSWHWVSSRLCHFSFFLEVFSPTLSSFLLCMYWSFSATHPRRSLCRSLEFSPQLSSLLCFVLQTIAALFSPDSQPRLTQLKEFSCVPPPCPWTGSSLKAVFRAVIEYTSLVSHFLGITSCPVWSEITLKG